MKKTIAIGFGISLLSLGFILSSGIQVRGTTDFPPVFAEQEDSVPEALNKFYPPATNEPVYLIKMISLADSLGSTLNDLMQNDIPNVLAGFQRFKTHYMELSDLIPEWKPLFPLAPLDELEASFKTGDPGLIMAAGDRVGETCTSCHIKYMSKVQYKYQWPDFSSISAKDPLTNEEADLKTLMLFMDASFSGIGSDLKQAQYENAERQFQGFKSRFETISGICEDCHGTSERKYFTDQSIVEMIDELGRAVADRSVEKTAGLHMEI